MVNQSNTPPQERARQEYTSAVRIQALGRRYIVRSKVEGLKEQRAKWEAIRAEKRRRGKDAMRLQRWWRHLEGRWRFEVRAG
jgi:hypothetical protein